MRVKTVSVTVSWALEYSKYLLNEMYKRMEAKKRRMLNVTEKAQGQDLEKVLEFVKEKSR